MVLNISKLFIVLIVLQCLKMRRHAVFSQELRFPKVLIIGNTLGVQMSASEQNQPYFMDKGDRIWFFKVPHTIRDPEQDFHVPSETFEVILQTSRLNDEYKKSEEKNNADSEAYEHPDEVTVNSIVIIFIAIIILSVISMIWVIKNWNHDLIYWPFCKKPKVKSIMKRRKVTENEYVIDMTRFKNTITKLPTRRSSPERSHHQTSDSDSNGLDQSEEAEKNYVAIVPSPTTHA